MVFVVVNVSPAPGSKKHPYGLMCTHRGSDGLRQSSENPHDSVICIIFIIILNGFLITRCMPPLLNTMNLLLMASIGYGL